MTQMTAQMMSEKEMFLQSWEREHLTTLKVLKAYPESMKEFKPNPVLKTARELAFMFAGEESMMVNGVITGKIDFKGEMPKAPATMKEAIDDYERLHTAMSKKLKGLSDEELNKTMKFFTAPKTMGDVRRIDVLWMTLMDQVHHRGQFSVYLRMAGGKVPSIYGPSADEPWM